MTAASFSPLTAKLAPVKYNAQLRTHRKKSGWNYLCVLEVIRELPF